MSVIVVKEQGQRMMIPCSKLGPKCVCGQVDLARTRAVKLSQFSSCQVRLEDEFTFDLHPTISAVFTRDLTKTGTGCSGVGITQPGMIQCVKHVGADLQGRLFFDPVALLQRHVYRALPRPAEPRKPEIGRAHV